MAAQKQKKGKRPDTRPAHTHYWHSGRLALRKIRNLVDSGWDPQKALEYWESARKRFKGNVPYGLISKRFSKK